MNVALHGMEEAAGVRYLTTGSNAGTARPGSPVLIRYADDALALCHSREQAEQVKARLTAWLAPRGLAFNEDKTAVVHLDDGVDFLGFNVRRYRGKLLIKPSKAAVKRIKARLTAEMKALRGHNAQMVLIRLNPVIRGWSAYYRHCVSSKVFDALDTPARPAQAAATPTAARALPALRGTAAPRRPGATTPRRMGTVDQGRPQGDPSPGDRPRHATRDPRRTRRVQPHPRPLPTPPPRRHRWWTSTSALIFTPSGLARAGCPESGHGRFQGGGGAAMRRRYPTGGSGSSSWRPPGWRCSWSTRPRPGTCPAAPRPTC